MPLSVLKNENWKKTFALPVLKKKRRLTAFDFSQIFEEKI